jgi:hypothetical protein
MHRLLDLVATLAGRFPDHEYLSNSLSEVRTRRSNFAEVRAYSRALNILDDDSWNNLRTAATQRFKEAQGKRGQAAVFDVLNSAVAYRHLKRKGYKYIRCLPESNGKKPSKNPDIHYRSRNEDRYCEVKTFHKSDHEYRREILRSFNPRVYDRLPARFFDKKLDPVLDNAVTQLGGAKRGIVFAVMHFDDIGPFNRARYKAQLAEHFQAHWSEVEIYVRFGINTAQFLHHVPAGAHADA